MHNWRRAADVRQRPIQDETLPGVIDTIGLGYATLWLKPQILLPPILLDLYLWIGLRVTARPVTLRFLDWSRNRGESIESFARDLHGWRDLNVLEWLSMRLPMIRMPNLIPLFGNGQPEPVRDWLEVSGAPWWLVCMLAVLALTGGFLIGAGYLVALASVAAGIGAMTDALRPSVTGRIALAIFLWLIAAIGLLLLVSLPIVIVTTTALALGAPGLTGLILLLLFPAAWGFIYFYFSVQALVVDRIGPFASMRASYLVVKRYFWQSIGFIAFSLTVSTGFPFALRALAQRPIGLAIAIAVNAFVASGMLAAGMLFYRDRARRIGLPAFTPGR